MAKKKQQLHLDSLVVHGSQGFDPLTGAVSFPIYQSATFRHPGLNETTGYDYSRLQNPTREELEKTIAKLESGAHGFAYSSGMAAIANLLQLFKPGDHILVSDDLYGGTFRLFEEIYRESGIVFDFVNTSDLNQITFKDNTVAVFIETPSNPMMKIADIREIAKKAKQHGALCIVDNTFLTPYFQRPLELGADLVVHSGTKYLGGHNDTLAGFLVVNDAACAERLQLIQKSLGAVLAPFDSWLILRGIKTLSVRLERQQANAMRVAIWLKEHKKVDSVHYVGLPDHPGYALNLKQASGFGAMISFSVKSKKMVAQVLERVSLIYYAESLGGVETLITYPIEQTHAAIPADLRARIGINDRLLRLSVGIESADDIINDLKQALEG
ncbi:MAG: PLP-dependent aspartate aminotransferase family protein [Clostridia bacterium]